jgi:predicted PurR-regulated permease PerM
MRALAIAVLVTVLLTTPAAAFQCPLLIKQLSDQVATLPADDPTVKRVKPLIEEARKLHAEGSHAKSIATAEEAAKVLGITLKKN